MEYSTEPPCRFHFRFWDTFSQCTAATICSKTSKWYLVWPRTRSPKPRELSNISDKFVPREALGSGASAHGEGVLALPPLGQPGANKELK